MENTGGGLQLKMSTFKKAQLNLLDLPLDNLKPKTRQTRQGGDGLSFHRPFSPVNSHMNSFFPHVTQIWNRLPVEARNSSDIDFFTKVLNQINLSEIKYNLPTMINSKQNPNFHYFM